MYGRPGRSCGGWWPESSLDRVLGQLRRPAEGCPPALEIDQPDHPVAVAHPPDHRAAAHRGQPGECAQSARRWVQSRASIVQARSAPVGCSMARINAGDAPGSWLRIHRTGAVCIATTVLTGASRRALAAPSGSKRTGPRVSRRYRSPSRLFCCRRRVLGEGSWSAASAAISIPASVQYSACSMGRGSTMLRRVSATASACAESASPRQSR